MSWRDLIWMKRLDGPEVIAAALRHPSLKDRAAVENALSRHFFAPFLHQEVAEGEAFERRALMSRAALALDEGIVRERSAAAARRIRGGEVDDLLDEVRRSVTRAMVLVTFGDDALEEVVRAAVADFDRAIKMVQRPHSQPRAVLAARLRERLAELAPEGTMLHLMQRAASGASLGEQIDHVASVLLGTGIIQVTDVVTHALIALCQHPGAARASDGAVITETIRRFPVNASLTRRASRDVVLDGVRMRVGEALTVVPMRVNRRGWSEPDRFDPMRHERGERGACFGFGHGPRACPARRLALAMAEVLLGAYRRLGVTVEPGYHHRRSLAMPPRARLGPGSCRRRSREAMARAWLRYLGTMAVTYPRVAYRELTLAQGPPPKMPVHSLPH